MIYYRTKDGQEDYGFRIVRLWRGDYRVYIEKQPPYRGRDERLHSTKRLRDGKSYYVCWDSPIRSLPEARAVAALWADRTQRYIQTGSRI